MNASPLQPHRLSQTAGILLVFLAALVSVRTGCSAASVIEENGSKVDPAVPVYSAAFQHEDQPEFAAFNAWAIRALKANPTANAARPASLPDASVKKEGIRLAQARLAALRALVAADPARALASAVPPAVRASLPADVLAFVETPFCTLGDFNVQIVLPAPDGKPLPETTIHSIRIDGVTCKAHVYGRRLGMTSKERIFLHGFLLDGEAVLDENVLRVLSPGEASLDRRAPIQVPVSATAAAAGKSSPMLVSGGGALYRFPSQAAFRDAEATLRRYEAQIGPAPAGYSEADALADLDHVIFQPNSVYTTGEKRFLVVRIDFSDLPGAPPFNGSTDPVTINNFMDSQIDPFLRRSSYAKTSLLPAVAGAIVRMPKTAAAYAAAGNYGAVLDDAIAASNATPGVVVSQYDRVMFYCQNLGSLPGSKLTGAGYAPVGQPNFFNNGQSNFTNIVYQLGSSYGLVEAGLWKVTDGNSISPSGTHVPFGDEFDAAGNSTFSTLVDFNVWFKTLLDWVPASQVQTVTESGTFRINQFDGSSGTGTLALKIVKDETRNYWLQVRRNFTANAALSDGVNIFWGYNTNQASDLLDLRTPGAAPSQNTTTTSDSALKTGFYFDDPSADVRIAVVAGGGTPPNGYQDVAITLGPGYFPVFSGPDTATGTQGSPFEYNITATGNPTSYSATFLPPGVAISDPTVGRINGTPTAGGEFHPVISATNSRGTRTRPVTFLIIQANDRFASAESLGSGTAATADGNSAGASTESGERHGTTESSGASLWYTYKPAQSGKVSLITSGNSFDTVLDVYTGSDVSLLTFVAGDDDGPGVEDGSSAASFQATANVTYHIAVSGFAAATGSFHLDLAQTPVPTITSALSASPRQGTAFSYQIAATNNPTSYGASGLPAGLGINRSTGQIGGTPTVFGKFNVTIAAFNEGGHGSKTLVLTVKQATPVITSVLSASPKQGVAFSYQITATNSPTTYGAAGLPAGLKLDQPTGKITGTPTVFGTFNATIAAFNGGGSGSAKLVLTVKQATPIITSALSASPRQGVAFAYQIAATYNPTSYGASGLPAGLKLDQATGKITGTATAAPGTYNATIAAFNGGGSGSAKLTLTVKPGIPAITSSLTARTDQGALFTYQVTATFSPTKYGASGLPAGLTINQTTGKITGRVNNEGTYTVTLAAFNAEGSGSAKLTLIVSPPAG